MPRRIELLPGNRSTANDVQTVTMDEYIADIRDGETDIITIDATAWLEGATISTATETSGWFSLSTSTPNITATLTGSDSYQYGDITITASDGRVRKIRLSTRSPDSAPLLGDGYWSYW